jgi:hypothetical protein
MPHDFAICSFYHSDFLLRVREYSEVLDSYDVEELGD